MRLGTGLTGIYSTLMRSKYSTQKYKYANNIINVKKSPSNRIQHIQKTNQKKVPVLLLHALYSVWPCLLLTSDYIYNALLCLPVMHFFFTYTVFSFSNLVDLELLDTGALAHLATHFILNQFFRSLWLSLPTHSAHGFSPECKANRTAKWKDKFFICMKP